MIAERIFLKDGRLRPVLRCLLFVIAVLFCDTVLTFLIASLAGIDLKKSFGASTPPPSLLFVSESALCASIVAVAFVFRRFIDRRSAASLGLGPRRGWTGLLALGIAFGAGMQAVVFGIDALMGYSHISGVADFRADVQTAYVFIPIFALVAVAEEVATRGYLFQNLWEEWGAPAAVVVTAVLFAALHLGNPNSHASEALTIAGLVAYGVWACASVMWTKSLLPAIGVHFAWNLFEGPVFGFPVSGLVFNSTMIRQTVGGPIWFTGGPFGPEAGASALVALALGLLALWWLARLGVFDGVPDEREAYAKG